MYLMSVANAKKYFPEPGSAKAYMLQTGYTSDDSVFLTVERERHDWWLGTPGSEEGCVAYVNEIGMIDEEGFECYADEIGVRPMIRVDISRVMDLFDMEVN